MMDDGSAAALQGFVALSQSTRGKAAAALIQRAVSKPGLYVFGELLEQPTIAALAGTEHQAALDLLQLFAYGTYDDVKAAPGRFNLTEAQVYKLKQLTVVSAATATKTLSYDDLQSRLDIAGVRALEDLIIACKYAGLVDARLNHRDRVVHVSSAMGRDLRPDGIDAMLASLDSWQSKAQSLVSDLNRAIESVHTEAATQAQAQRVAERKVEELRKDATASVMRSSSDVAGGGGGVPLAGSVRTDWDAMGAGYNPDEATRRGRPKRRHAQVASAGGPGTRF